MDAGLRPLTTSQVLDRTFQLYKKNFLLFVGIAVVGPGLTLIASLVQIATLGAPVMPDPQKIDPLFFKAFFARAAIGLVINIIVLTVGNAIATGATIHAVSMVHLGKSTTILESYRKLKAIFWRLLWLIVRVFFITWGPLLGVYLVIIVALLGIVFLPRGAGGVGAAVALLGLLLLVFGGGFAAFLWGIYAYCRYALAVPACTVEGLPAKHAIQRAKFLSRGSFWRIFAIFALTILVGIGLTFVLQIPSYFFANPFRMQPGPVNAGYLFFAQLGEFLGRTFAGPIATIAIALVYYDERVRKEAFDLQLMIESLPSAGKDAAVSAGSN